MRLVFSLLIVTIMALGAGSSLLAQDLPPIFCGDLSDSDCDILANAQAAGQELEAADFVFAFDFAFDGGSEDIGQFAFGLKGDGAYISDLEALQAFGDETIESLGDPAATAALYSDLFGAIDAELNLTLLLDDELLSQLGAGGLGIEELTLETRLVEGVGYINMGALAEQDPTGGQLAGGFGDGWLGIDLNELLTIGLSQADAFGGADLDPNTDLITGFSDPELMGDLATIERLDDQESMGQTLAVFQTTIDFAEIFSEPLFVELMQAQFAADPTLGDFDIDMLLAAISESVDGVMVISQSIGLDDFYTHSTEFSFAMTIDSQTLVKLAQLPGDSDLPVISFSMEGFIDQSNFNDVPPIEEPEDAFVLPLSGFLGPTT